MKLLASGLVLRESFTSSLANLTQPAGATKGINTKNAQNGLFLHGTVLALAINDKPQRAEHSLSGGFPMLYWSVVYLLVATVAGVAGFTGMAGAASDIAKLASVIFLVLLTMSLAQQLLRNFELVSTTPTHKRRKP